MPFDGSGNYAYPAGTPGVSGQPISSTTYNAWLTDMNASMSKMLCRDGQAAALADIPMGGFKFTGLAAGSAAGHSLRYEQLLTAAGAQLIVPDGLVGAPGFAFGSDLDNGAYRIGANDWALSAGGVKVAELLATGVTFPLLANLSGGGSFVGTFSGTHTNSGVTTFSEATSPIVTAKLGPTTGQQHLLPAVTSDTIALLAAAQTFTTKTFTSPTINGGALSGTFSGAHTLSGIVTLTANPLLTLSQNGITKYQVTNANGGTAAYSMFAADNGTKGALFGIFGTAFTTSGAWIANRAFAMTDLTQAEGFLVGAQAGPIVFAANGTAETARFDTGKFGLGITPVGTLHVHQAATPTMYLTDNVLGSTYGGVIRGYGLGGNGGYLELGVLDGGTFLKGIQISQQTNSVSIWTGTGGTNANQFSIGTGGAITITAGQLIFPATQNPAAGANTLDDYEEGTFTPTITFGGSAVGVTYGIQAGFYTKIGNRVIFSFYVVLTSKGSSTGAVALNGLPFTSANVSNQYSCTSQYCGTVTNNGIIQCYVAPNTTQILMEQMTPATGVSATITNTNVANTSNFMFTSSYQTA